jgi:hypothetical protein
MVTMAFPSRSRLTLTELRQALSFIDDAGVVSYSLTHAPLEVFFCEEPPVDTDPSARVRKTALWDVVHLDKRCGALEATKASYAPLPVKSRTVRTELLTSDVLQLCEQCASEPLGRRLHNTMTLLLLASNVVALSKRLEDHDFVSVQKFCLSDTVASLYSVTSTLKKDLASSSEAASTVRDIDDVLRRAASAVLFVRDKLAEELVGRATSSGLSGSDTVLAYFEHDYVSPWKQDPVESLIRFAWDDSAFVTQVFQRVSSHAVGDARGLIILPRAVAELWCSAGHHLTIVTAGVSTRLRELLPLTWALLTQGGALSDPFLAFKAATVLMSEYSPTEEGSL